MVTMETVTLRDNSSSSGGCAVTYDSSYMAREQTNDWLAGYKVITHSDSRIGCLKVASQGQGAGMSDVTQSGSDLS